MIDFVVNEIQSFECATYVNLVKTLYRPTLLKLRKDICLKEKRIKSPFYKKTDF